MQARELKLENDTLISVDRMDDDAIVETLNPKYLSIDTSGMIFSFYTRKELIEQTANSKRPVRYVEVGQIIDYWRAARISLNM